MVESKKIEHYEEYPNTSIVGTDNFLGGQVTAVESLL